MSVRVENSEQMRALGKKIGPQLHKGDIILLNGTLGVGKTTFVQGLASALGVEGITSPTFVISKTYPGLIHVDAYRLVGEPAALFDDLDLDSQMAETVTVVEWGEGFVDRLSDEYLEILIEFGESENQRVLSSISHGKRWEGFRL